MPILKKHQNAPDSPSKEETEDERGRQEVLEESEEKRIWEHKEAEETRIREDELRHGHAHTPYFEYDNPSYEDKEPITSASNSDKKKNEQKKKAKT
jgi:hypothetical protein